MFYNELVQCQRICETVPLTTVIGSFRPLQSWPPLMSIIFAATALAMSSKLSMARSIFRGQRWFEFLFQVPYDLRMGNLRKWFKTILQFSAYSCRFHTIVITTEVDIHDGHITKGKFLHVGQLGKVCRQICLCLIYSILYLLFGDFGRNVCIKFYNDQTEISLRYGTTLLTLARKYLWFVSQSDGSPGFRCLWESYLRKLWSPRWWVPTMSGNCSLGRGIKV